MGVVGGPAKATKTTGDGGGEGWFPTTMGGRYWKQSEWKRADQEATHVHHEGLGSHICNSVRSSPGPECGCGKLHLLDCPPDGIWIGLRDEGILLLLRMTKLIPFDSPSGEAVPPGKPIQLLAPLGGCTQCCPHHTPAGLSPLLTAVHVPVHLFLFPGSSLDTHLPPPLTTSVSCLLFSAASFCLSLHCCLAASICLSPSPCLSSSLWAPVCFCPFSLTRILPICVSLTLSYTICSPPLFKYLPITFSTCPFHLLCLLPFLICLCLRFVLFLKHFPLLPTEL